MSEALEKVKKCWSGHRGVVTKHLKKVKHILDSDVELDEKYLVKVKALCNILKEKFGLLNTLDEQVLVMCPTDDIERQIKETEEMKYKIVEICTEIEGQLDRGKVTEEKSAAGEIENGVEKLQV